ncbi:hypothetical protein [Vibrio panuliri]|uniref:Uncharacterized protein n=1 Tax=Vibrio panuliri TaxID=1381081 RepID=A0ABX3FJB8_9VIBR|nr:hypothetical protein [Vibrio panuliri]KAB1460868.1 hypothetical protein F7O85_00390 [Vibrio panuliri]OLQ91673.1 hypothetical protein BIY20_09730 [Vibrio panuliri]
MNDLEKQCRERALRVAKVLGFMGIASLSKRHNDQELNNAMDEKVREEISKLSPDELNLLKDSMLEWEFVCRDILNFVNQRGSTE